MRSLAAIAVAAGLTALPATAQRADSASADSAPPSRPVRVFGYPYAFFSPETQFAFGVGGILYFRAGADTGLRPSKVLLSAYYTSNQQYKITASHDLFTSANRTSGTVDLSFGEFIDKFYGTGPEAPDTGQPAYLLQLLSFETTLTRRLGENGLKLGGIVRADRQANIDTKENGFLNDDLVLGSDGGWVTGVGVDAIWDSRDNVFSPTRGGFSDVRAIFYPTALGGDFEFMEVVADLRWYQTVGGSHVVGIQAYGAAVGGAPPYFRLPKLGGGSRMRGYYEGRYRDRLYLTGQAEYRTHLFWRVGVVVFGGVGSVAPSFNEFDLSTLVPSYGFGLRYLFDAKEKINVRADFGFGRNTSGVYFAIEEAF